MKPWIASVAALAVVASVSTPALADGERAATLGHTPPSAHGPVSAHVRRTVGAATLPAVGGGYNVRLRNGRVVHTHGPDSIARMARSERQLGLGGPERPVACGAGPHYQHVLYGRVAGSPDNIATQAPVIRGYLRELNHMLDASALLSSDFTTHADMIVRCDAGEIAIGSFQAPAPVGSAPNASMDAIIDAAISAGFADENVDYTIFFEHPARQAGLCGIATYGPDDSQNINNMNNNPPGAGSGYAVAYGGVVDPADDCWNTTTALHEMAHNQGAVQDSAPHATGSGHCTDGTDVMCYDDEGPNGHAFGTGTCPEELFDCNNDDYFDVVPSPGSYLDERWNLGSVLNRFIRFSEAEPAVGIAAGLSVHESVGDAIVTLTRSGSNGDFSVRLSTSPGTAGTFDYTSTTVTVDFAPTETSKTIAVPIRNDATREPAEAFTVALSEPDGALIRQATQTITIRASDQQPDEYIKLAGASYRGSNVYNGTALNQTVTTSARRGQTRTFYVVVQNDGNVRNVLRVKAVNSSGTSIVVNGSSTITNSVRSLSGRQVALNPGATVTFRVDFKMLSGASGTEQFTFLASWSGDRVLRDLVKGTVRVL